MSDTQAVIFDMDGVLADTEPLIADATIRMFRDLYAVELTPDDFKPFIGTGAVRYVEGPAEADDPDSVEAILADAIDLVATARPAAMSSSVKVDRDEMLDLLEAALDRVPIEVREARRVLRDRDELLAEGRAREVISRVQNARKSAGLDVADRVLVQLGGAAELLEAAQAHEALLLGEVLGTSLALHGAELPVGAQSFDVDGAELHVTVRKAQGATTG